MARIGEDLTAEDDQEEPTYRRIQRVGEVYVARKVARRVINELRQWVPEQRVFEPADDES
jgi:hypothetical protein